MSEQEAIDCTAGSCARGGWMTHAWEYWRDNGALSRVDYRYTAKDQTCRTTALKAAGKETISTTKEWGKIVNQAGITDVIEKLSDGPLAVAVAAGNKCWRFYKKGVLSNAKCATRVDHAVTLTGYTPGIAATEGAEPVCETVTNNRYQCKRATW